MTTSGDLPADLLAEVCDDPDDEGSDYGRGYQTAVLAENGRLRSTADEDRTRPDVDHGTMMADVVVRHLHRLWNRDGKAHRDCERAGWKCAQCGHEQMSIKSCERCGYTVMAPLWKS